MKKLLSILVLCFCFSATAQSSYTVEVGPGFTYTPSELSIIVGDEVTFILEGGMHDVNFNISMLTGQPFDNPAEVESLPMQSEPGVMGTITFDVPGTYNYDCSNYGHASMGMVGSIIVDTGCVVPEHWVGNTGGNMTLVLMPDFIQSLPPLESDDPYIVALSPSSGLIIGSVSVSANNLVAGQTSSAIWGDDTFTTQIDGAIQGEEFILKLVDGCKVYTILPSFHIGSGLIYQSNGFLVLNDSEAIFENTGCMDSSADNFDENADFDDGSCIYSGCVNPGYLEYWSFTTVSFEGNDFYYLIDPINEFVNLDDGTCNTPLIQGCVDNDFVEYNQDVNVFNMDQCLTPVVLGCTDESAFNYSVIANTNDGSCYPVIMGCMDQTAFNYIELTGDPFIDVNTNAPELCVPVIYGCLDPEAYNFNDYDSDGEYNELTGILGLDVNTDDGSCIERIYGCLDNDYTEYNDLANTDDGSCQMLLRVAYNELNESHQELTESYEELNSASSVAVSELQLIIETWNTTIDLEEGWNMFGYGCPDAIDLNSVLDSYIDIELVKDNNGSVYWPEFDFNGIGDFAPGYGYQIKLTEAIEGFSLCDWYVNDIPEDNIVSLQDYIIQLEDSIELLNTLPSYEVGDYAEGGIVFYVDETGQHGFVVSDIIANVPHWDVNVHVNNFNSNGIYQDWYFPSIEELETINQSIGLSQLPTWYWSSSYSNTDENCDLYWGIGGNTDTNCDFGIGYIVVIRSF